MKDEYDFSRSRSNPYSKQLKKQITIRIDEDTIEYFRKALYGFQTDRRGRRSVAL